MKRLPKVLLITAPVLLLTLVWLLLDHTQASTVMPFVQWPNASRYQNVLVAPRVVTLYNRSITPQAVLTSALTLDQFVLEQSLQPTSLDQVSSSTGQTITTDTIVTVTHSTVQHSTEYIPLPPPIEYRYSSKVEAGKKEVVQIGRAGQAEIISEITLVNDQPVDEKVIDKKVLSEAEKQIVLIGTKQPVYTMTIGGQKYKYTSKLRVWATSYDHTCKGCNHYTATGKYLTEGIIAVDPRVIPLHTRMYVPGYGFGQAEDVGGAIKGNKIDLGFEDLTKGDWSARWVDIYILQ